MIITGNWITDDLNILFHVHKSIENSLPKYYIYLGVPILKTVVNGDMRHFYTYRTSLKKSCSTSAIYTDEDIDIEVVTTTNYESLDTTRICKIEDLEKTFMEFLYSIKDLPSKEVKSLLRVYLPEELV
jgi:hypothetical protein